MCLAGFHEGTVLWLSGKGPVAFLRLRCFNVLYRIAVNNQDLGAYAKLDLFR